MGIQIFLLLFWNIVTLATKNVLKENSTICTPPYRPLAELAPPKDKEGQRGQRGLD
jgi:hypothetical protein